MLTEILEKSLESDYTPSADRRYYVSDMGKCKRVRWLKRKGIQTGSMEGYVKWILQIGNLYHEWVYEQLERSGVLVESEVAMKTDHFSGRFDGVIQENDAKMLFDVKSIGAWKLKKVLDGEDIDEYIMQLFTYLVLQKMEGRTDLSDAVSLLFVNKEPSERLPHAFVERKYILTNWRETKIRAELEEMANIWTTGEIPRCTCPGWMKNYNNFLPLCQASTQEIEKVLEKMQEGYQILSEKTGLVFKKDEAETRVAKLSTL